MIFIRVTIASDCVVYCINISSQALLFIHFVYVGIVLFYLIIIMMGIFLKIFARCWQNLVTGTKALYLFELVNRWSIQNTAR